MARACHIAVRSATGDVFTDDEIDDFLSRMEDRARRARAETPSLDAKAALAEAAGQLSREELHAALVKRRMAVSAEIAQAYRRPRLDGMPGTMDEAEKLRALDVGSERQGLGTSDSTDARARAQAAKLWGRVELGLHMVPGLANRIADFWGRMEKDVDRKIAREMARINGNGAIEPTGDEGALHAARVFVQALRGVRDMQNDMGAWIADLPGYIARQSHDRLRVSGGFWRELAEISRRLPEEKLGAFDWKGARVAAAKRAFRQWRDYIRPRLDPRTFEGLELEDVPMPYEDEAEEARQQGRRKALKDAAALHQAGVIDDPASLEERFLYRVWWDIVTGRHEQMSGADDTGEFRAPASTARSVSKSRVLHFKDPDAWVDYNQRYGRGNLFQTVMGQLGRGAQNAELMRTWGPNPEAARQNEIGRLADQARTRGDEGAARALTGWRSVAAHEAVNGRLNVPESLRMAMVAQGIRGWEAVTKLGGIVLSKATDLPMTGHTFARTGAGFLKGYEAAIKGLTHMQGEEGRRAADLLDVGARSFAGHLGGQFSIDNGFTGWNAWAARTMYRLNLFEFVNESIKRGAAEMVARHFGQEADSGWAELRQGTRETLERFGIDRHAWDLAREGVEPAADGRKYFTLDHVDRISDRDILRWKGLEFRNRSQEGQAADRAREELSLRFRAMMHNIIDDTTSEPRARERIGVLGTAGTRAGTLPGEAVRAFGQFKGFLNTILGRHLAPAATGYAGYKPVALIAHFIVASSLAGYLSMSAKAIARGEQPRTFGEDPAENAKLWMAALAQGGGLGIYGDFLFGERNRNDVKASLLDFGGPAIGDAERVAQILTQAIYGGATAIRGEADPKNEAGQIPGELVKLAASNIPLVNLFYTRLALDYLVLWRLQEAVSPGYLERYQQRAEQERGAKFIVPPTAAE